DGHFVVECEHDGGHTIPTEGVNTAIDFLMAHQAAGVLPWQDGLPDTLPGYCHLPE
ncbi:MAG: hypothetical protein ACI8RZ_006333, partial [Myxococcota bacterium]